MTTVVFTLTGLDGEVIPHTSFKVVATYPDGTVDPEYVVPAPVTFTTDGVGVATVTLTATTAPYYVSKASGSVDDFIGFKFFVPQSSTPLAANLLYVDLGRHLKLGTDRSLYALIETKVGMMQVLNTAQAIQTAALATASEIAGSVVDVEELQAAIDIVHAAVIVDKAATLAYKNAAEISAEAALNSANAAFLHSNTAELHATTAESAADAALASGNIFETTVLGMAGTASNEYFSVPSAEAEGFLDLYQHLGSATFVKSYPSLQGIHALISPIAVRNQNPEPVFADSVLPTMRSGTAGFVTITDTYLVALGATKGVWNASGTTSMNTMVKIPLPAGSIGKQVIMGCYLLTDALPSTVSQFSNVSEVLVPGTMTEVIEEVSSGVYLVLVYGEVPATATNMVIGAVLPSRDSSHLVTGVTYAIQDKVMNRYNFAYDVLDSVSQRTPETVNIDLLAAVARITELENNPEVKSYEEVTASVNLLDLTAIQDGKYISSGTGQIVSGTNWGCSDYIPVTAGEQYVISGARGRHGVSFFTSASPSAVVAGSYNGTETLPLVVTAPVTATHMVIGLYKGSATVTTIDDCVDLQVELGNTPTVYIPYGETLRLVRAESITPSIVDRIPISTKSLLVLNGTGVSTKSYIEVVREGRTIKRTFTPWPDTSISACSVFEFDADLVDGVEHKDCTDDMAPYRFGSTIATVGAGHGYAMTLLTLTAHGKTVNDIGSIYSVSGTQHVIVGVPSVNTLYMTARSGNGGTPIGTFTYVSGGTNTADFTVATAASSVQWYPPFKNRNIQCFVDGEEITATTGSMNYKHSVTFVESYDLMAKPDIVAWVEANGSGGYTVPDADACASVSMAYVFDTDGNCTVHSDFLVLKNDLNLQDIMFLQAARMTSGVSGDVVYYIPKTLPLTHEGTAYDYNLKDDAPESGWSARLKFLPSLIEPTGLSPDRVVMLNDTVGFAIGYLPEDAADPSVRRTNTTVKSLELSTSSSKVYLSAIDKGTYSPDVGQHWKITGYRNILINSVKRTCAYPVRTNSGTYFYVDWHVSGVDRVVLPTDLHGKSFTVVEKSSNVDVLSTSATSSLVFDVDVSSIQYAYAILKFV